MPQCVAFLRAINVGGHTVKMDALRSLFEAMKCKRVETFIASGNVIFESSVQDDMALARKIESHLHRELGYEVRTFIRTPEELTRIASSEPFPDPGGEASGRAVHVAFLQEPAGADASRKLKPFVTASDKFHIAGREVFWLRLGRVSDSDFSGAVLEKTLQVPATLRNMTTVRKISAKFAN